jgi:hypothetical protein
MIGFFWGGGGEGEGELSGMHTLLAQKKKRNEKVTKCKHSYNKTLSSQGK